MCPPPLEGLDVPSSTRGLGCALLHSRAWTCSPPLEGLDVPSSARGLGCALLHSRAWTCPPPLEGLDVPSSAQGLGCALLHSRVCRRMCPPVDWNFSLKHLYNLHTTGFICTLAALSTNDSYELQQLTTSDQLNHSVMAAPKYAIQSTVN